MNMKRFAASTTREAMQMVKAAFGDDAVVLSTKPCPVGIEVLAMAPEGLASMERLHAAAPAASRPAPPSARADAPVQDDVNTLAMSTLSFQDYVRERMLRRRKAELSGQPDPLQAVASARAAQPAAPSRPQGADAEAQRRQRAQAQMHVLGAQRLEPDLAPRPTPAAPARNVAAAQPMPREDLQAARPAARQAPSFPERAKLRRSPPVLREEVATPLPAPQDLSDYGAQLSRQERERATIAAELKAMKGLIEQRFGALAFMEKLQRQPVAARLAQTLLQAGFSPALVRKLTDACPSVFADGADELQWAQAVLANNLQVAAQPLEERQGVFALVGSTGVGKTTCTAKIAAGFAARHGAAQLGLITLDAYRIGAHEQLRAYGRILGVPVHTAHDRASLEDLLDLLANKRLVLIDTAGMAQRDSRTAELLDMLAHPAIRKLIVVNASAQGETIEDGLRVWQAAQTEGVVLSKLDEAVRLAPALDGLIRHRVPVQGVANGQRVPEDWVRLSADALVQHALRHPEGLEAWQVDQQDLQLRLTGAPTGA